MKDLFGNDVTPAELIKKNKASNERKSEASYKILIQLYGKTEGRKCGACKHFYFRMASKKYPKCALSGCDGHTQNHDWSSRWNACGKFEEEK
jgi:hypothetical protein